MRTIRAADAMRWLAKLHRPMQGAQHAGHTKFQCNLCGAHNEVPPEALGREIPSCGRCGSTVRCRALVHLVCTSLLGEEIVVPNLRARRDLCGIGLSDAPCVATALASVFDYVNTYFHTEPRLDIAKVPEHTYATCDFVTASDVFEHVAPPVDAAFANARKMLKPEGVFVFTVPFSLESASLEHFPELHDFTIVEEAGAWRLYNRTSDGREQCFHDLVFHGGPGTTLEMRLFSRAALERHFADAGFSRVQFASEACQRFGIVWPEPWSIPVVAHA